MSVIFDALRRARRRSEESSAVPTRLSVAPRGHVPGGLGLTPAPMTVRSGRAAWLLVVIGIAISIAVWLVIGRGRGSEPAGSPAVMSPQRPAGGTGAPPPATAPATPAPSTGRESVAAGDVLRSAPEPQADAAATTGRAAVSRRESHFSRALRLHNSGRLDEAAAAYLAAIADNDRHVEARNNLGLLYRSRGQTSEAVEQFRRALAMDARYVTARNHLAVMSIDAGRLMEARDEIAAGLAVDPRNADLLVNLALVERAERRPDRAIELLLRALGDRPTHAAAHYNLGLLYDERNAATLAYTHYVEFLTYSGPEYGAPLVDEVRRRAETLARQVGAPGAK